MKEEAVTDALLRQFLLGQVDDDERQRIERLFITDSLTRERVLAVEEDLLEDYLEGSLTALERDSFLSVYGATPIQQRKLRIAETIKQWARTETNGDQPRVSTSIWSRLRSRLSLKPVVVIPIAVTASIAIIFVAVWLNSSMQRNRHRLAIEQEVARLNTPPNSRQIAAQVSRTLSSVSVRGGGESELTKSPDLQVVELRLLLFQGEEYSKYRAVLHRVGEEQAIVTTPDLQAENEGGKVVRVKLPAGILTRGTYQIELNGIAADGAVNPVAEYVFTVSD
jgi:hypothetical protein